MTKKILGRSVQRPLHRYLFAPYMAAVIEDMKANELFERLARLVGIAKLSAMKSDRSVVSACGSMQSASIASRKLPSKFYLLFKLFSPPRFSGVLSLLSALSLPTIILWFWLIIVVLSLQKG